MHFISEAHILKEIKLVQKDMKKHGHTLTKILAKDSELQELSVLARSPFNRLKKTGPQSFTYRGIRIIRDERPAETHQH